MQPKVLNKIVVSLLRALAICEGGVAGTDSKALCFQGYVWRHSLLILLFNNQLTQLFITRYKQTESRPSE